MHRMKMSALLLLLVAAMATPMTPSPILSQCVQSCDCYLEPRAHVANLVVECRDSTDLPPIFPPNTTRLRVDNVNVTSLRAQLRTPTLSRLRDLEIVFTKVEEVAVDAFRGLTRLRKVDLSHNKIAFLSPGHFVDQRHLELVDLTGNTAFPCLEFTREMAQVRPSACVKCDGHQKHCSRTTRGQSTTEDSVLEASPSPGPPKIDIPSPDPPKIDIPSPDPPKIDIPSSESPNIDVPSLEAATMETQDLLAVTLAGVIGGAVGACLVVALWFAWDRLCHSKIRCLGYATPA